MERNNEWLEDRLFNIWEEYFIDIPRKNLVLIKFGKYSKRQLGSIKWATRDTKINGILKKKKDEYLNQDDSRISVISITRYFENLNIPEYVIDGTIAHELVHYTHGFHSPLPKTVNHPHKGRVVQKELLKRGLGDVYKKSEVWLKENWRRVVY
jgi:hypothetical protein